MKTYLHEKTLKYDGTQLHSHFAYENFNILGDSIVSFIGPCEVKSEHMVDLADRKENLFIYSENMVHFIVEHFQFHLFQTIALQRLLICLIQQDLENCVEDLKLIRQGDDLFDDVCKLNVSIATKSPTSTLIHVGVNISSERTPVPTKGLNDYGLTPQAFANSIMNRYREEITTMNQALAKVKGVS